MGVKYTTILSGGVVSTYNDDPPIDDGTQSADNRINYSRIESDLSHPLHSAITTMDGKLVDLVDEGPTAVTTNYTTTASDFAEVLECSGDITITLLAPAGNAGYKTTIKNAGTGDVTIDVSGGSPIDSATTATLQQNECRTYRVNAAGDRYLAESGVSADYVTPIQSLNGQTAVVFSNLPAELNAFDLVVDGASYNTSAVNMTVQLGDSGGIETTGYSSSYWHSTGGASGSSSYLAGPRNSSVEDVNGVMHFRKATANDWVMGGHGNYTGTSNVWVSGGTKSTSATLSQVQVAFAGGVTMDGGQVRLIYRR